MLIAQAPTKNMYLYIIVQDQIHKYFSLAGYISNVL